MIPTKPSGYSIPDGLPEWSVKFWERSSFAENKLAERKKTYLLNLKFHV